MSSNPYVYASPHHTEHTVHGAKVPVGGAVFSIILSLTSIGVLSWCLGLSIYVQTIRITKANSTYSTTNPPMQNL